MNHNEIMATLYTTYTICGLIILAGFYVIFKTFYNITSNYNRIEKESKYLLDIEFEEGKLDKEIYDNALSLVSTLCLRNIFDVSLEPCGEDELSINIKKYCIYLSLTKKVLKDLLILRPNQRIILSLFLI